MRGFEKYIDSFLADQTTYKRKADFVGEDISVLLLIVAGPAVFYPVVDDRRARQSVPVENMLRDGEVCGYVPSEKAAGKHQQQSDKTSQPRGLPSVAA